MPRFSSFFVRSAPGRRFSLLPLVLVLGLTVALEAVNHRPARADVRLDLTTGFDNNYRPGTWTPLHVRISGAGVNPTARLQVTVRSQYTGTRTYSQPAHLSGAQITDQTIYYLHPELSESSEIVAQLVVDGRIAAEKKLEGAIQIQEGQPAVLGLTQDQSGLNYLTALDLGIVHRRWTGESNQYNGWMGAGGSWQNAGGIARGKNPTRVLYPTSNALPATPFGYSAVDAVMLGDVPIDALSDDQWSALSGWIKDGGVLVISGGADVNRAKNKALADLLPVTVTGSREVRSLPSLSDRFDSPFAGASIATLTGTAKQDAIVLCEDGGSPTVALRRIGSGMVVYTSFDMLSADFRKWPSQAALWQEIMQRAAHGPQIGEAVLSSVQPAGYNPFTGGRNGNQALTDALAGLQASKAPDFKYIGLFLLAYVICLVPLNYLLLKKWDRKELAWVTAPLIILLFSTGAYAVGYNIKGGALYLNSASVIEGAADTDGYAAYTLASIFSPRQQRYDITVADSAALPMEITEGSNYQRTASDLNIERDQKTAIRNAVVNMWDHRNFDFESHVDLGGSVSVSVLPAGPGLGRVRITNGTGRKLSECSVSFRGNQALVGTLESGNTKTVALQLNGTGGSVSIVSSGTPGASPVENQIKQALASCANGSNNSNNPDPNSGQAPSPFVFTGWFTGDVVGLALDGEKPQATGVNLLVVHIPIPNGYETAPSRPVNTQPPAGTGMMGGATIGGMGMAPAPTFRTPPANTGMFNNQAYTYANQGRLDLAMSAANRALRLAPRDGNILDTVGEMHQRRKEYKIAAQYYTQALNLQANGGMTETHEKYGETLLAMGQKDKAIAELQKAAANSQDAYGIRARQALQRIGAQTAPNPGIQ